MQSPIEVGVLSFCQCRCPCSTGAKWTTEIRGLPVANERKIEKENFKQTKIKQKTRRCARLQYCGQTKHRTASGPVAHSLARVLLPSLACALRWCPASFSRCSTCNHNKCHTTQGRKRIKKSQASGKTAKYCSADAWPSCVASPCDRDTDLRVWGFSKFRRWPLGRRARSSPPNLPFVRLCIYVPLSLSFPGGLLPSLRLRIKRETHNPKIYQKTVLNCQPFNIKETFYQWPNRQDSQIIWRNVIMCFVEFSDLV